MSQSKLDRDDLHEIWATDRATWRAWLAEHHDREVGVWLGALASVGLSVSTWRALLDETFPEAMRPHLEVEVLPAPPPDAKPRASS